MVLINSAVNAINAIFSKKRDGDVINRLFVKGFSYGWNVLLALHLHFIG